MSVTSDPPPAYNDVVGAAEKFSKEKPAEFAAAIVSVLKDPKTNEALAQQIADLGSSIRIIKRNFENVSNILDLYDAFEHVGEKLKPEWDKLHVVRFATKILRIIHSNDDMSRNIQLYSSRLRSLLVRANYKSMVSSTILPPSNPR